MIWGLRSCWREKESMRWVNSAPRLVAKGRGDMAERIIQIAKQHGVQVRPDADLAEVLSKIDLGKLIPPELYKAVAEVLAF